MDPCNPPSSYAAPWTPPPDDLRRCDPAFGSAFGRGIYSFKLKRGGVNGRPRNDGATDGAERSRQQKRPHRGRALPWHNTCTDTRSPEETIEKQPTGA